VEVRLVAARAATVRRADRIAKAAIVGIAEIAATGADSTADGRKDRRKSSSKS
jgi:hypothetical protein